MSTRSLSLIPLLILPTILACGGDDGRENGFTSFTTAAEEGTAESGDDMSESGDSVDTSGDGDGDTSGDGDGDTSGDGDGDTSGDGDGDSSGDGDGDTGGECMTPPDQAGSSCGQDAGYVGAFAVNESNMDMPIGTIFKVDNGPGNGYEDWYRFDFPIEAAAPRPGAGVPTISFAMNEGDDYKFQIFRACGAQAYGQGLAAEFGSNAPPLIEWSFFDDHAPEVERGEYLDEIFWPDSVWVRVYRTQNDETCSSYQLQVSRPLM